MSGMTTDPVRPTVVVTASGAVVQGGAGTTETSQPVRGAFGVDRVPRFLLTRKPEDAEGLMEFATGAARRARQMHPVRNV